MPKEYITVKEMAKRLGISLRVAYKFSHMKGFPAYNIGRIIRIPLDEMESWLAKRKLTV